MATKKIAVVATERGTAQYRQTLLRLADVSEAAGEFVVFLEEMERQGGLRLPFHGYREAKTKLRRAMGMET